jgi:hypothetical protein
MSLTTCRECGEKRSTNAKACPSCGSRRLDVSPVTGLAAAAAVVATIAFIAYRPPSAASAKAAPTDDFSLLVSKCGPPDAWSLAPRSRVSSAKADYLQQGVRFLFIENDGWVLAASLDHDSGKAITGAELRRRMGPCLDG